jgi:hypothetical protein
MTSPIFMQVSPEMHASLAVVNNTELVTFFVVEILPGMFVVGGQFKGQDVQTLGTADSFADAASLVTSVMEENHAVPAIQVAEFTPLPVGFN